MNQIMNVAAIGTGTALHPSLRKPAHAAKANLAARKDAGSSFRIPRGSGANPTSARAHKARIARDESNGSGNSGDNGSQNGQHGKPKSHKPRRSGKHSNGDDGNKKLVALAALLGATLVLAGIGIWHCSKPSSIEEATGGWFYDQDSTAIQEAIDHEVEDGYFNMNINTSVPVSDGVALVGIKNIPDNKFDCAVTITLEDGTEIYKSGGLAPGSEIKYARLTQDLSSGDHEATALFEIYEQDDAHTKVGQTASKLTLHVK